MGLNWIRTCLFKMEERQVFGLDIGSSSVNAVQLQQRKRGGGWQVKAANRVKIAPYQEQNKDLHMVSAINECIKSRGFQKRVAVCGLSGPEVAVRDFKFPLMAPEEMEPAVLFEATQVCPFDDDDITVDYQILSTKNNNASGVLVAATNKLISEKTDLARQASVECVLMDAEGLALLNCFSECEKEGNEKTTAILNIGTSYATLAIMSGQGTLTKPFIRDVPYAGDDIVKAIADEQNMSTEDVKAALFGGTENSAKQTLEDSLERACDKLITDVTDTLRFYTAQEKSSPVERIFVCGGYALVKGLVGFLDKHIPAKAVLWNPFEKIGCSAGQGCEEILDKDGPAMAIAAGLAMRSI